MGIQINGNNDIISALDGSWTAEGASINTSGILTATTFVGNITGTAATFTGPVTIGGTLTYEDVTNIDSVGIITARDGLKILGGGANVVGVVTATSFAGALPISNDSNDRVLTSSGSGVINAEANLTMTGNVLTFNTTANSHRIQNIATGDHYTELRFDSNRSSAGDELAFIDFQWDGDKVADIIAVAGSDTTNKDDGHLVFRTSPSQGSIGERLRITSDGKVGINRTTPAAPITARRLDAGGSNTAGVIAEFANSSGYGVWFGQSSASGAAWGSTTGDFYWCTNGLSSQVERLRITSTGQLLLGISNAVASDVTLQVHSASSGVGPILNMTNDTGDCRIFFGQDNSSGSANSKGQIRYNVGNNYLATYTAGTERLRIDSSGQIGVGNVTPKTWSLGKAIHIGNAENAMWGEADYALHMMQNAYYNGGYKYTHTDEATLYSQEDGRHTFKVAASGTADAAITWVEALRIKSNGQIGVNMAPSSDAQFCIKNSDDSNYNVLDVYNDNGNKMGGFSQDSTGNGTIGSRTNAGDLNVMLRSSGNSYFKGGRLLIGTDAHSISSSEMFEVKHATTGFSYFENDNTSGYAPIYINNKGANSGFAPIITITDGSGNRAGLGLDNSEVLRVHGQGGVEIYTGGTMGGGTQHWRINNLGDLTHTFAGRHGSMIGSTDGSGAYILLDGAEGNPLSSGTDYMYMEHTSGGNFEMWNGNGSVSTTKFMEVSPAGYIRNPKQPSFAAYRAQSSWSVSAGAEMVFNNTRHNIGSHYSTSTGRFTAPVSGSYLFTFFIIYQGNHNSAYVRMFKNGSRQYGSDIHFTHADNSGQWDNVAYSQIFYLAANDYVSMYNGNHTGGYHGNHWMQFCGYLLG